MSNFKSVKKFMQTFGQEVKNKAEFPEEKIVKLRLDLIREELEEFREAVEKKNIKEMIKCQKNKIKRLKEQRKLLKQLILN